jgi:rRNA-processing protein FCF1
MPNVDSNDMQQMVTDGLIGAISLDTSIFDQFACNLDSPSLEALEQFVGSSVQVILTDVVLGEVRSHLAKSATEATARLNTALKDFSRFRRGRRVASKNAADLLNVSADIMAEVDAWITQYLEQVHAVTLSAGEFVSPDRLLADYLASNPPFENAKGKKAEFPDAIALMELECWAAKHQKYVLAVSKDQGWAAYAEKSDWVLTIEDLASALGLFNRTDAHIVERTAALLCDTEKYQLASEMSDILQSFVDDLSPWVDAQSPFQFYADYYAATIKSWVPPPAADFTVIESDTNSVTMTTKVTLTITAEADFSFYVHDAGDDISIGGTYAEKNISLDVPIVLKVARESGPDDVAVSMAYETQRSISLDFGYVEPDVEED